MVEYFNKDFFLQAQAQRKKVLIIFYIFVAFYVLVSAGLFFWISTLPYAHRSISTIKTVHHFFTGISVLIGAVYLGITYKRVNKYYKMTAKMVVGIKETYTGSFLEYDDSVVNKDGVDLKSLVFVEWNKFKNDFFERKVYVFNEQPFPEIEVGKNVKYVTQGNVLISYEILS